MITLVKPDARYKVSFMKAHREFRKEGWPWHVELDEAAMEADFDAHVRELLAKQTLRTEVLVPETVLWGIVDDCYAGRLSIRHELTDGLRICGGHIGYDTAPSYRKRGVASAMLALALPIARSIGLGEVLLTCDDTNVASIKVIEKNGGVLRETRSLAADKPLKRYYWIRL